MEQYKDGDYGFSIAYQYASTAPGLQLIIEDSSGEEHVAPCGCYVVRPVRGKIMVGLCPLHDVVRT